MNKQFRGAICRHCQAGKVARPRGLCWACYYKPGVKELYPSKAVAAPMTEAELEASIAEQLGTMPRANVKAQPPSLAAIFKRAK